MKTPRIFFQINPQTSGMPESPAKFPGGFQAMYDFIEQHLTYPFAALEAAVEGTVMIRFLVTETGLVQAPNILEPLHNECDREALRLAAAMPKWIPARNAGAIIPVQVTMPVYFKLANVPVECE